MRMKAYENSYFSLLPITSIRKVATFLFWGGALVGLTSATILTFLDLTQPWFGPLFVSRAVLALLAAGMLLLDLADRQIPALAPSAYALAVLAAHSGHIAAVGPTAASMDVAGVFFLLCALLYRGSMRLWWALFMPASLALLFLPVVALVVRAHESGASLGWGALLRLALVPMLSLTGAALIAALRVTRARASDVKEETHRLAARNRILMEEMQRMERDMKSLLALVHSLTEEQALVREADVSAAPIPSAEVLIHAEEAPEACLDSVDVYQILSEVVDEIQARLAHPQSIRLVLQGPKDVALPMAIRGERESLALALRSLISLSVDSLGRAEGVVWVGLRLGLRRLSITIEDNGRGFNEAMILKMEAKGSLVRDPRLEGANRVSLTDVRKRLQEMGASMEIIARLGVGARTVLDFPRVDSFATFAPGQGPARINPLRSPSNQDSRHA